MGLGAGGLFLGAWGLDSALGWGLEARGLGCGRVRHALCAMCYMLYLMQYGNCMYFLGFKHILLGAMCCVLCAMCYTFC